jgi:ketosteroid isomerase-like protein
MSQENLEQLHRAYAEWGRGDFRAGGVRMAPGVRCSWETPEGPMEGQGPAEVKRNFREFLRQWSHWRTEAREFVEIDDNCFLVVTDSFATGKQSGVEISSTMFHAWVFRGDEAVEWHSYFDRDAALEAAGLSE